MQEYIYSENIIGTITIMKTLGIKPNFAALGRQYDLDWRTVKRYYYGYEGKPKRRKKRSSLDQYQDIIKEKLKINRVTVRAVYEFMVHKYGRDEITSYSNFAKYVKNHRLQTKYQKSGGHPRFERLPGEQAQCDWKEDITIYLKSGKSIVFNIFHLELKFSRFNYLGYSRTKETYDVFRHLINALIKFGGVPKEILFDNMTTVVHKDKSGHKYVNKKMATLAKEFGFKVRLCKAKSPETKGSVEARNKILDWIRPYQNEYEEEEQLIPIIEELICKNMNIDICQGTNMSPIALFYKEKEYLSPLPSNQIIDYYLNPNKIKVGKDSMINYKGNRYSVRKELIGETVSVENIDQKLYIYYRGSLEVCHLLSNKKFNYHKDHYEKLMLGKVAKDDMSEVIETNLNLFDSLLKEHTIKVSPIEASQSEEALIAFLNQDSSGKWVLTKYRYMNEKKKKKFITVLKKLLPLVDPEYAHNFISILQYAVKDDDMDNLALNCLVEDNFPNTILTVEGVEILMKEYKDEYIETMEDIAEWMHKDDDTTTDSQQTYTNNPDAEFPF